MDNDLEEIQKEINRKNEESKLVEVPKEPVANMFDKPKELNAVDNKDTIVNNMFEQAIVHQVSNNEDLKNKVLQTAKTYTDTKMQTIATNVDTEHKEANFNNKKDACESYGFNEKTTPIWATNLMNIGYNIMLAIWLFVGTFTFMPVIFIAKKIVIGIKKTWIAVIVALLLYLGITFVPILLAFIK